MGWVKTESAPTVARNVKVHPDAPVFSAGEGPTAFTLGAPGQLAQWQHLAAVLHHGTMTLYVDGQEVGQKPAGGDPEATIRIGSLGKKEFLSGLIDEVRIWDRALTPAEITAVYQREKPKVTNKTAAR